MPKDFAKRAHQVFNFVVENDGTKIQKDFSILVGDNGTGKSTFLEAVHLALTGYYRGRGIIGNVSQDLFNKECVESFLKDFNEGKNPILPKISIEVFFDDCPKLEGNYNSTKSKAYGFTFEILYDDRNDDAYSELLKNRPLNTLPFEFYKCEWSTFARERFTNSKFLIFKSAYLNTNVDKSSDNSSKLIRSYIDDFSKIELNQAFRLVTDGLKDSASFKRINEKLKTSKDLKDKNITIGIANTSQNAWETAITIKEDGVPYENIGTGKQCIVNTVLSFENDLFKNKGIILIEEPENHLSGMNLNILLDYIKKNSKEYQVIITTHSSFVLNKLGMNNLMLLSVGGVSCFSKLPADTAHYFEKVSGYDTLRFILSKRAFLVEGDSDDLIIQRSYYDKYNKLPVEDGIEIIDTGLSYKRFLDLAKDLKIKTIVVTDNDGDLEKIKNLRNEFKSFPWIKICSGDKAYTHAELGYNLKDSEGKYKVKNVNTLEPEILRANDRNIINSIINKEYNNDEDLLCYMIMNKTEVAWEIFNSDKKIVYPKYICDAIDEKFSNEQTVEDVNNE